MSDQIPVLEGETRAKLGTRYTARLRNDGKLPAVVYGHGQEPAHIAFNAKAFNEAVHTGSHLLDVTVDGKTEHCLLKSVQWDYLGRTIIHADLTRVDLTEKVEAEVELILKGEPKAAQAAGAMIEHPVTVITISCVARNIPDNIVVDISELTEDKIIHASDVELPAGAELVSDADGVVAHIVVSKKGGDDEATEANEPEVIEKGKKEED